MSDTENYLRGPEAVKDRLRFLEEFLNSEGWYVKANTALLALERIEALELRVAELENDTEVKQQQQRSVMKISNEGLLLLSEREGVRTEAYLDSVGVPTIGVGHTGPEVHLGLTWPMSKVMEVFREDIARFEEAVRKNVKVPLAQHQFDALVSFAFNVGVNAFERSTMLRKLNTGDYQGAINEFPRWVIPSAIRTRRAGEQHQFIGDAFVPRHPDFA